MKVLIFFIAILFFISCSRNGNIKESSQITTKDKKVKGKVRWIRTGTHAFLTIYDERGNVTYSRTLHIVAHGDPDTVIIFEDLYKYDKNDSLIEREGFSSCN